MSHSENARKLTATQVAIALVMAHYGPGFLVGTGQDIVQYGAAGMLYAFSTALGLLALIPLASYYWRHNTPIWDSFAQHHGKYAGHFAAFLSSFWMLGVVASQIFGGAAALMIIGFSQWEAIAIISAFMLTLSHLDFGKLTKIFAYFLGLSSVLIAFALFKFGSITSLFVPLSFIQALPSMNLAHTLGIVLTTVCITIVGMDFHQFIVEARSAKNARRGSLLGALVLGAFAVILGGAVTGFISHEGIDATTAFTTAQVVPKMLIATGTSLFGAWSTVFFLLPVIIVSLGSGSAVTKAVVRACSDTLPKSAYHRFLNTAVIAASVAISFLSQSVIGLIVSFYAVYLASVLAPFGAILLEDKYGIKVTNKSFLFSIFSGLSISITTFIFSASYGIQADETALYMLAAGTGGSLVTLLASRLFLSSRG